MLRSSIYAFCNMNRLLPIVYTFMSKYSPYESYTSEQRNAGISDGARDDSRCYGDGQAAGLCHWSRRCRQQHCFLDKEQGDFWRKADRSKYGRGTPWNHKGRQKGTDRSEADPRQGLRWISRERYAGNKGELVRSP